MKLVLRAEFHRRWRSWLALAALIAVVSGLVPFATGAGPRSASAFPRFIAAHGYDAEVYTSVPLPESQSGRPVLRPAAWALTAVAAGQLGGDFVFEVFLQPTAKFCVVRVPMDSAGV